MSDAIRTRDLCYRAGSHFHLDSVSLAVPEGAIFGFLGANGAGKSTTLRLLMGMLPARSGEISVLGHAVPDDLPTVLARTGYVPERPHLYRHLTVGESMAVHRGFHPGWDGSEAENLLERFSLQRNQPIRSLSKGEVGKLLVLQAVAQRPDLLVLDEPTDGLDPVVRRDLYEAIVDYVADSGATVVLSSHLVHELERVCDHMAMIDGGRIVEQGTMERFRTGIRTLRVTGAVSTLVPFPFQVLRRDPTGRIGEELWLVRGWTDDMSQIFETPSGNALREVSGFDLETGFVELLRSARSPEPVAVPAEV